MNKLEWKKVNAKNERDMKTKNLKTKNLDPNKRVLKGYGYCVFGRYPLHIFPFRSNMVPSIRIYKTITLFSFMVHSRHFSSTNILQTLMMVGHPKINDTIFLHLVD